MHLEIFTLAGEYKNMDLKACPLVQNSLYISKNEEKKILVKKLKGCRI